MKVWFCKVGVIDDADTPRGADTAMRREVKNEFEILTGVEPDFCFSGWGGTLTEDELAAYEDREPDLETQIQETTARLHMLIRERQAREQQE